MSTLSIASTFTGTSTYSVKEVRTSRVFVDDAGDKLFLESVNSAVDALKLSTSNATSGITASTGSSGLVLSTLASGVNATGGMSFLGGAATNAVASGAISLATGSTVSGAAGAITLLAGDASGAGGTGGSVSLSAGTSTSGTAGDMTVAAGDTTTGTAGNLTMSAGIKGATDGGAVTITSRRAADGAGLSSMFLQTRNADNTMRLESLNSTRDGSVGGRWAIELESLLGGINIKANKAMNLQSGAAPLTITSGGAVTVAAATTFGVTSVGNATVTSSTGNVGLVSTAGQVNMSAATTMTATSTGNMTLTSGGNVTIGANSGAGTITLNGIVSLGGTTNLNIPGNMSVAGNMTVGGTTTYMNTETLTIEDNIITVNLQAANAVQLDKPDGGLVMYRFPGDYIATATLVVPTTFTPVSNGTTAETPSRLTVTIPSAAVANFYKGMLVRQAATPSGFNWAIIDESSAPSGPNVTLTLGGRSATPVNLANPFNICFPQTVGVVFKEAVHVSSKTALTAGLAEGGMICAQSLADPGDTFVPSSFTNSLCDALVVGAGRDIGSGGLTGLLYFGQAQDGTVAGSQWRIASNNGNLQMQKWVSGAWVTKAIWS